MTAEWQNGADIRKACRAKEKAEAAARAEAEKAAAAPTTETTPVVRTDKTKGA